MIYRDPGIDGWMLPRELDWLYSRATEMNSVIEVGCWKGRSTHALLSGCQGTVYAVDHWKGSPSELDTLQKEARTRDIYRDFLCNVGGFQHLQPVRMASIEAADVLPSADMVFIDGEHTEEAVREDLIAWNPKARRLIAGHDWDHEAVRRAVRDVLGEVETVEAIWYRWQ